MKNLFQRLKDRFWGKPEVLVIEPPVAEVVIEPPQPKGQIVKSTRPAEYNPDIIRRGGRIVKVMPRQLQKIKQAQEKVEDD